MDMALEAILLPGGVMPAGLAYGPLLEALGDDVKAIAKENDDLSHEERALWREFDRIATLPSKEMMPAFVAIQLAPGVEVPPSPPGPPPPWMATRPAGLRALMGTFSSSTLDLDRLRTFEQPVYFALGGRSNHSTTGKWPSEPVRSFRISLSTSSTSATTSTHRTGSSPSAPRGRCGLTGP
jgi:hypothetical protein